LLLPDGLSTLLLDHFDDWLIELRHLELVSDGDICNWLLELDDIVGEERGFSLLILFEEAGHFCSSLHLLDEEFLHLDDFDDFNDLGASSTRMSHQTF